MMDQLMNLANELEPGLRKTFQSPKFENIITGVSLDVDEYWEASELMHYYRYDWLYSAAHSEEDWQSDYFREALRARMKLIRDISNQQADFDYRPKNWENHCERMGYPNNSNPLIIRIYIQKPLNEIDNNLPKVYNEIYPIVYEVKGKVKLVRDVYLNWLSRISFGLLGKSSGKAPAAASKYGREKGTIGGLLKGVNSSKIFLITCGHVLGQTGSFAYSVTNLMKVIGRVVHFAMPTESTNINTCSEFIDPNLKSIDVSIAELQCSINEIDNLDKLLVPDFISPTRDIRINDIVTFIGKTSGKVKAKVGPLTLWYAFEHHGVTRCFGRIFELKPQLKQYVYEPLARPGDSGAWVVSETGYHVKWYGMIIASENSTAYASFSEFVVINCSNALNEALKL